MKLPVVVQTGARLLTVLALACVAVAFSAPRVFAVGAGVAESLGLRDASDNVRARLGAQNDGKYGLQIWYADVSLAYDLTPGAGTLGAPRVATSVAGLGTGMKDGEIGYLRLGSGSANSLSVVWDATRDKWVSAPQPLAAVLNDFSTTSTTDLMVPGGSSIRHQVVGLKDLYDAGMRPEVYVESFMHYGGGGSVVVQAAIGEIANGGTGSTRIATGGEVSTTSIANVVKFSDWTALNMLPAPTHNYGFGQILIRVTGGDGVRGRRHRGCSDSLGGVAEPEFVATGRLSSDPSNVTLTE